MNKDNYLWEPAKYINLESFSRNLHSDLVWSSQSLWKKTIQCFTKSPKGLLKNTRERIKLESAVLKNLSKKRKTEREDGIAKLNKYPTGIPINELECHALQKWFINNWTPKSFEKTYCYCTLQGTPKLQG